MPGLKDRKCGNWRVPCLAFGQRARAACVAGSLSARQQRSQYQDESPSAARGGRPVAGQQRLPRSPLRLACPRPIHRWQGKALLWFFGLPAGTSTNLLDIKLSLTDREDRELWSHAFSRDDTITQGLSYNWGNDALQFASLLQTGMNEALQSLARELPKIQDSVQSRGR